MRGEEKTCYTYSSCTPFTEIGDQKNCSQLPAEVDEQLGIAAIGS